MKTYPAEVIRKAMHSLIDRDKYVRFSMYVSKGRPIKIKAKISCIWCTPEGIRIGFHQAFLGRRFYFSNIEVLVKDIRWITSPFDGNAFEQRCQEYVLKLIEGRTKQVT